MNSKFIRRLERMLDVSVADNARISMGKDGTINFRSVDSLGTKYKLSINSKGSVTRSRVCSLFARSLNVTKKTAPRGVARSRWSAANCFDYSLHETVIKNEKLLDKVRELVMDKMLNELFLSVLIP